MKLYDLKTGTNTRRVRIFLAEKGVKLPTVEVDMMKGENKSPDYLSKNPMGTMPLLELDDGTQLAESVAICRYIEELHPERPLFGTTPIERALVEMWNRRMELNLFAVAARAFQHTNELFKARIKQFPEYGETQRETVKQQLQWLDAQIGNKPFIAGDRFTIADITALVAVDFAAQAAGVSADPALKNLARWHQSVSSRPSANA